MDVKSLINEELIVLDLDAQSQSEVFEQLSTLLIKQDRINSKEEFIQGVQEREAEFSTGFGNGFAIPHCKSETVKTASVVIGRLTNGVDWNALDNNPVDFVIMLAIPKTEGGTTHLQILAALSGKLMDDDFRENLLKADQPEHILILLDDAITKKTN
jgi:fructose-specific phosphotransferase system IIA component